jgi:hypothetical protein
MADHGTNGEQARRRHSFTPEFKAEIVGLCQAFRVLGAGHPLASRA